MFIVTYYCLTVLPHWDWSVKSFKPIIYPVHTFNLITVLNQKHFDNIEINENSG